MKKEGERLTNIVQLEGKVVEGEPVSMEKYEVYTVDWERKLSDHKEMLEREYEEMNREINLRKEKENTSFSSP